MVSIKWHSGKIHNLSQKGLGIKAVLGTNLEVVREKIGDSHGTLLLRSVHLSQRLALLKWTYKHPQSTSLHSITATNMTAETRALRDEHRIMNVSLKEFAILKNENAQKIHYIFVGILDHYSVSTSNLISGCYEQICLKE